MTEDHKLNLIIVLQVVVILRMIARAMEDAS